MLTRSHDHRAQRGDGTEQGLDVLRVIVVGDGQRGTAVLEDVGDLGSMQARVHRNGHQTGMPDAEHGLEILGPIAHDDGDAAPRFESQIVLQATGDVGGSGGELRPRGMHLLAIGDGRGIGQTATIAVDPGSEIHGNTFEQGRNIGVRICGRSIRGLIRNYRSSGPTAPRVRPMDGHATR